jgi:cyclopropane fatty-acyl-phospholipid synthase-like methyltransferase
MFEPVTCGCGAAVPFAALKCNACGREFSHREWYPEQYSHPLVGRRVSVRHQGSVVAAGTVDRVVSSRFGMLAHLGGGSYYSTAACEPTKGDDR